MEEKEDCSKEKLIEKMEKEGIDVEILKDTKPKPKTHSKGLQAWDEKHGMNKK